MSKTGEPSIGIQTLYRLNRRNLEWHFFMRRKQADGLDVHNRQTIAPSIHLDASTQRQSRDPAACAGQVRQELTAKTRRADRAYLRALLRDRQYAALPSAGAGVHSERA